MHCGSLQLRLISCCSIKGASFHGARQRISTISWFSWFLCVFVWLCIIFFKCWVFCFLVFQIPIFPSVWYWSMFVSLSFSKNQWVFSQTTFRTPKDSFSVCLVTHGSVLNKQPHSQFVCVRGSVTGGSPRV